jgi:hypothetical protein
MTEQMLVGDFAHPLVSLLLNAINRVGRSGETTVSLEGTMFATCFVGFYAPTRLFETWVHTHGRHVLYYF